MKTVYLTFHRRELLYDLGNYAWIEGDVMRTDDEHARHPVIDINQDGNRDRVDRMLKLYFTRVVELLFIYTKHEVVDESQHHDPIESPQRYIIRLSLPDDFSETTVRYLEQLIHNYLVDSVLYEWMRITYPEAALKWKSGADELEEQIKSALTNRSKVILRKMFPW